MNPGQSGGWRGAERRHAGERVQENTGGPSPSELWRRRERWREKTERGLKYIMKY